MAPASSASRDCVGCGRGRRCHDRIAGTRLRSVSSLLVLYDLHPDDFETRVERGIEKARTFAIARSKPGDDRDWRGYGSRPHCDERARVWVRRQGTGSSGSRSAVRGRSGCSGSTDRRNAGTRRRRIRAARQHRSTRMAYESLSLRPHAIAARFRRLRGLAREAAKQASIAICAARDYAPEHSHLAGTGGAKADLCCANLARFCSPEGAAQKYKRVPRRTRWLRDFQMTDGQWDSLMIPIGLAFFLKSSIEGRVLALYPSPAGPTESLLSLESLGRDSCRRIRCCKRWSPTWRRYW